MTSIAEANLEELWAAPSKGTGRFFLELRRPAPRAIFDLSLHFVSNPQDLYNRSLESADSVQDARHRFVANFTASTPDKGMALFRNFEFSSIINLQTPRPFTIFVGNDVNGDTNPVTDRVGWSPRNSYRGDHLYSFDLRLARQVHFS